MLRTRILTAAVLIGLLLVVLLWLPPSATWIAMTAAVLAGAWEWSAFLRLRTWSGRALYVVAVAACLLIVWQLTENAAGRLGVLVVALLWWVAALLWVTVAPHRVAAWSAALAGILALAPAWMALVRLRVDVPRGAQWLLFALCLVWAADVGAYFAGRSFGRTKLAPQVSPGKTWEGVAGGLAFAALVALWGSWWFALSALQLVPVCLVVVAFSIVGDLTESLLKRFAGLKDSGTLFPGHGGVMDRIDSLTSAMPMLLLGLLVLGVVR
ncbi:MAG TPA: phosphatidate cytidylyltransferase [Steroidobacteraceae bacterium]|nr:phosphatidate cytidylyltransferase [Steroidobacteraceae bacterium]